MMINGRTLTLIFFVIVYTSRMQVPNYARVFSRELAGDCSSTSKGCISQAYSAYNTYYTRAATADGPAVLCCTCSYVEVGDRRSLLRPSRLGKDAEVVYPRVL